MFLVSLLIVVLLLLTASIIVSTIYFVKQSIKFNQYIDSKDPYDDFIVIFKDNQTNVYVRKDSIVGVGLVNKSDYLEKYIICFNCIDTHDYFEYYDRKEEAIDRLNFILCQLEIDNYE